MDVPVGDHTQRTPFVDYPAIAKAYAKAVVAGTNLTCRLMMLAAQRYLDMLEMAAKPGNEFYFSPEHVCDYCAFLEKLQHVESGLWESSQRGSDGKTNRYIILDPSQIWVEAAIQGFRRKGSGERLVVTALEVLPRKNAKSLKIAGAALYDLCCSGQLSPQIPIGASTSDQGNRVFSPIAKFVQADSELVEQYKIKVTQDRITTPLCGEFDGIFKLSSIGERQDGFNPSLAIFEEGHAGAAGVFKVVMSAFGARPNQLLRMITTAGYRPEGPAWEMILEAEQILNGKSADYTFFAAIYTLDREDYTDPESNAIDWTKLLEDETLIAKANPMYRVSLDPVKIRADMVKARRRPDLRGEIARTRFDIWTGSGLSLIEASAWAACRRKITLDDFIGMKCWIGVDLAQVLDMCAIGLLFELPGSRPDKPILAAFAKYFLPMNSPTATDPEIADLLQSWADPDQGEWLVLTEGALADHDRVREEVEAYCSVFDVQVIACDPHQAHNTVKHLWDGNLPVMVYPNSANTMTAPTDDILGRVANQTIIHDGNPVLAWNASNVHGQRKGNGLILPRKNTENSKSKIDGFVALCFADGCRLQPEIAKNPAGDEPVVSAYAGDRVIGLDEVE